MRKLALMLLLLCSNSFAAITDIKFGQYQIADSQWNVSACLYTTTCQIYSKNPGTAYKIPWYTGQVQWAAGDYVKFDLSGNGSYPYTAKQYDSAGNVKSTLGDGKIVNMGPDYFFFVGSDDNTGQLFSGSLGMNNTSGVTWTGTLNPTIAQADAYADTNYSTEPLAAGATAAPSAPALCCGGSSAPFAADPAQVLKINNFLNRTTADSQVYIEQIGNQNTIVIDQSGTRNNYAEYIGNGDSNTVAVSQGTTGPGTNYAQVNVTGSSNAVNVVQNSTGGTKSAFVTVDNNSNTVTLLQKDSGGHHADINVSGGNKTVDVVQEGSGNHMAKIELSGAATSISVNQAGSTSQSYSIQHSCAANCSAITVIQGK
jgi:hypothetical protein